MINSNLCSVHMHLYYEDMSEHIIKQVSKVWNKNVYISLIKDAKQNKRILSLANEKFSSIQWVEVENKGTDQYGFFFSNKLNTEKYKPWILYIHDKSADKLDWLNDIMNIFTEDEYQTVVEQHMNSKKTGIISAKSRKNKVIDSDELIEITKYLEFKHRGNFVKSVGTLAWLRELQNIFYNKTGIVKQDMLNTYFVSGTVFMARKSIVDYVHSCVHVNFFENGYRSDGEVEHAMERFYFYVSECLGYNNVFI